ncbi:MerR family transcriptional regulator [Tunturiibacter gelidiferens]|uniref:MerR family transcriptional regulator n=1 Tax=Tunturiibacter gelidiferens TaxID=3069689 RepID=UPI003D9B8FE5
MTRYSRQDVIRILHLQARQLTAWERAGLISPHDDYSFEALGQLRRLRDLQATTKISAKNIRASVDAMQRLGECETRCWRRVLCVVDRG